MKSMWCSCPPSCGLLRSALLLWMLVLALWMPQTEQSHVHRDKSRQREHYTPKYEFPQCGGFSPLQHTKTYGDPVPTEYLRKLSGSGNFTSVQRMYKGQWALATQFPTFVSITGKDPQWCGGVLLTDRMVLTTLKCVEHETHFKVGVTWEHPEKWSDESVYKSIGLCRAHGAGDGHQMMLAILFLKEPVPLRRGLIETVCIGTQPVKMGERMKAVGVGYTDMGYIYNDVPPTSQWLDVERVPCPDGESELTFCAKSSDPDVNGEPCEYDYGGPLYGTEGDRTVLKGFIERISEKCSSHSVFTAVHMWKQLTLTDYLYEKCKHDLAPDRIITWDPSNAGFTTNDIDG